MEGELLRSFLVEVPSLPEPIRGDAAEGATDQAPEETVLLHGATSAVDDVIQGHGGIAYRGSGGACVCASTTWGEKCTV